MTIDTLCQSPVTNLTQRENTSAIFASEGLNNSDILAKTLKRLTMDSTINDSAYYNSDEDDAESDPKSDPLVATHTSDGKKRKVTNTDTTNRNSPHLIWINRLIPEIIPVSIPPIDPTIADGMISGMSRLINNLCGEFPLIVSVSVNFLFFLSLV